MFDRLKSKVTQQLVQLFSRSTAMKSVAASYQNLAGYRQMGLKYDDLLRIEDEAVKEAIKRLPKEELQNRIYRQKRAMQTSILQKDSIKTPTTQAQDAHYLLPLVFRVEKELDEKAHYDNLK